MLQLSSGCNIRRFGCINVEVGRVGPSGRRRRAGRSALAAALRDWPALRPDAPSARRSGLLGRPAGCGVSLSGDEVGVVGEQLVSMKCREPVVWCTADVHIRNEVSRDRRALRHAAVDCCRLRGREARVSKLVCRDRKLPFFRTSISDTARRRVVTDVSLSRRLASTQCFRRRRATSACSARRTLAAYLSSASLRRCLTLGAVSRAATI